MKKNNLSPVLATKCQGPAPSLVNRTCAGRQSLVPFITECHGLCFGVMKAFFSWNKFFKPNNAFVRLSNVATYFKNYVGLINTVYKDTTGMTNHVNFSRIFTDFIGVKIANLSMCITCRHVEESMCSSNPF